MKIDIKVLHNRDKALNIHEKLKIKTAVDAVSDLEDFITTVQ